VRPRKSRASAADRPPLTPAAARTLALGWLGLRELSRQQVRQRLLRRGLDAASADALLDDLAERGVLDDERVARAAARRETAIKGRGPARTRATLKALGLPAAAIDTAVDAALADVDADTLLERALAKRLRGLPAGRLDAAATRRLVGALVRQGFSPGAVFARLRRRGADVPDEPPE
jgi:regulatory protein